MKNCHLNVKFRTDSGPLPCDSPDQFSPFKVVEINLNLLCPMCHAVLSSPSCNCEDFILKLKQLRTIYDDMEMYFHYGAFDLPISCVFPLDDVLRIKASDGEKEHLDWTNANWSTDDENKCGFLVMGISYNETLKTAIFYYKKIGSDEVWKGVISRVDLKMPKIYFGKYISLITPNLFGKPSGGDYEVARGFTDWNDVCKFLTE